MAEIGAGRCTVKRVLAIDPGPLESAFVIMSGDHVVEFGKSVNSDVLRLMRSGRFLSAVVCERIRSYGMPVGAETFETCEWCGRFRQVVSDDSSISWYWLSRKDVVINLCGSARAKDSNVRQACIDRFGGNAVAIGRKATPGPLYGVSGDVWSALGVALTWIDNQSIMTPAPAGKGGAA